MTATNEVVLYSTGFCSYCIRARALLERKGAAVREIKVDEDAAERQAMVVRTGGLRSLPQIFIGDRHIGGFQELYALDTSGELDKLLGHA
jgi:glutaredoxin 3